MATEHELKLKATLDTTEVRREIERLNSSRGSQRSGVGSSSPNATFSRLSTTLSKLDMTLTKLLAAVQSMARISNVNPAAPMSAASAAATQFALAAMEHKRNRHG